MFLASRNYPRELENIDARDLDVLIANFLLQIWNGDREKYEPVSLSSVFCKVLIDKSFVNAFSFQLALYFTEDLGCAAKFAIIVKLAFGSTICDLLLLIFVTKLFQWQVSWYV